MKAVAALHREAMDLAEAAFNASVRGERDQASELFRAAYEKERAAAEQLKDSYDLEPSRSVLFRSAASLALDCEEWRQAERLIALGLAGDPPDEIADELRDLLEQVHFARHLELRGVELAPEEFQFSLAGKGIGYGVAPSDAVTSRINSTERMLLRIAERKAGRQFREAGPAPKAVADSVEVFMSVPRAASFAVTFRVGRPREQVDLPELTGTTDLIDEMMTCLTLFQEGREGELQERIGDEAYFNNFTAIAKQIAPDGVDVTVVGFTTQRRGSRSTLQLTKTYSSAGRPVPARHPLSDVIDVSGRLLFADERGGKNLIGLVDDDNNYYKVEVPRGMMGDIVKPLWEDVVTVTGTHDGKTIMLKEIRRAEQTADEEREVAD
jgi:hypothetical protein